MVPFRFVIPRLLLTAAVLTMVAAVGHASDTGLTGHEGHPRSRFPLAVAASSAPDAEMEAAVKRAVADWNALFEERFGVPAFRWAGRTDAAVVIALEPRDGQRLMGETRFSIEPAGVIGLPVTIAVFDARARGQTDRETLVYQVVAHELGHALGLEHVTEPRSLMCCVYKSLDFSDPAVRQAYLEARRHPDVRSVTAQLAAHYDRFWRGHR